MPKLVAVIAVKIPFTKLTGKEAKKGKEADSCWGATRLADMYQSCYILVITTMDPGSDTSNVRNWVPITKESTKY